MAACYQFLVMIFLTDVLKMPSDGDVPDIHSIIYAMEALRSPSSLGLACNFELLEQMNPAKPDFT
jgi:hypothetical protein